VRHVRFAVVPAALMASALLCYVRPCPAAPEGAAAGPPPLTLCLAAAADDSPVYPLTQVPANHREAVAVFRIGPTESFKKLTSVWTAVDVGATAPAGSEIGRGDLDASGNKKSGSVRFTLPRDLPVGKYRLDVAGDGKPWASLPFTVVEAAPVVALAKPEDLLPLAVGTRWSYAFELEPGPIVKNITLSGAERGDDGHWRAPASYKIAATEDAGARVEMRRTDTLVNQEWWKLDATGLSITRQGIAGAEANYDPPVTLLRLPLASPASWTYTSKDKTLEIKFRMWGPLPVIGPNGPVPGYVVVSSQKTERGKLTVERHFVPGIGIVLDVLRESVGPYLRVAMGSKIVPAAK